MRFKKTAAILGATAMVGLAGPAFAAPPFTVSVGGSSAAGTHDYSAASKTAVAFVVNHGGTLVNMGCTSGTATGDIISGAPVSNDIVANIQGSTWTSCIGPGGLAMTVTQNNTWDIVAEGGDTSGTSDVVTGRIANVDATVTASANPALCSFTVAGSASGSFHENGGTGQQLHVNEPNALVVSNVSGCLGLIATGDTASFTANYDVTVPDGPVNIS